MKKSLIVFGALFLMLMCYYVWPEVSLPKDRPVDKLIVYKSRRELLVYSKGELLKAYTISLGRHPLGHKHYEGDKRTPEGRYTIFAKNPNSGYHKNLGISYPNALDRDYARKNKLSPGGDVKLHGLRNGTGWIGKFHRWMDWTAGCIALTNGEIDELYNAVAVGTPIWIYP